MKLIQIKCDKCKSECNPASFGAFIYPNVRMSENGGIAKEFKEEHFCLDCVNKIINYINTL